MIDDMALLREFARSRSEEAFATLVSRHINLVYSVALREVHDLDIAQELTQAVFSLLAQKADSLNSRTIVSGWLWRTTRNVCSVALRTQRRRERREQQVYMQAQLNEPEPDVWTQIEPLLETAIAQLAAKDHDAVVLRFIEGRSFKEVGAALCTSEAGAKMRVNRALEKLRDFFKKRGFGFSIAMIGGVIAANSVQGAPIGLATTVTVAAVKGTGAISTLTLIKTTLRIMTYTKLKTVAAGCLFALLLAGTSALVVHRVHAQASGAKGSSDVALPGFAGFASPEAALKSFIWSESTGELQKLLAACTPGQVERFKKKFAGMPEQELRERMLQEAKNRANYVVTDKELMSDTEVWLHLQVQPYPGHPNVGNDIQVMQKIGDEWRYAGKYGVDIKEN
jgi:RNA polymerase sigma factor (sigma-70 family)